MVYILGGGRTPQGHFLGKLSTLTAPELGGHAIAGGLSRSSLNPEKVEEVIMGNVVSAGVGQAPARQAALGAGLGENTPAITINKVCGSGMQAVIHGAQSILTGERQVVVAGGMENMSLAPHLVKKTRSGQKYGALTTQDALQHDGLTDAGSGKIMGVCAEECAKKYDLSRADQDEYAITSFKRALAAQQEGKFAGEICKVATKREEVESDEGPTKVNFEKIPQLRPAFSKEGTITAANASTLSDGASALVLAGDDYKEQASFKIRAYASFAQDPLWFTTAPLYATQKVLKKAGLTHQDIDLYEINEAFAIVPLVCMRELEIEHNRVNIYGGGISLGHPIGSSGSRIILTLMSALQNEDKTLGLATLCIGGGEALAVIIERLR